MALAGYIGFFGTSELSSMVTSTAYVKFSSNGKPAINLPPRQQHLLSKHRPRLSEEARVLDPNSTLLGSSSGCRATPTLPWNNDAKSHDWKKDKVEGCPLNFADNMILQLAYNIIDSTIDGCNHGYVVAQLCPENAKAGGKLEAQRVVPGTALSGLLWVLGALVLACLFIGFIGCSLANQGFCDIIPDQLKGGMCCFAVLFILGAASAPIIMIYNSLYNQMFDAACYEGLTQPFADCNYVAISSYPATNVLCTTVGKAFCN